jgi:chromate transporter
MGAFLDGVNVASLALMAVVAVQLGRSALVDAVTILLTVVSGVVLFRYRANTTWLILAGAGVGYCRSVLLA